jgi:hypothetical protein
MLYSCNLVILYSFQTLPLSQHCSGRERISMVSMKDLVTQLDTLHHEFSSLPFSTLNLHSKRQIGHAAQRVGVPVPT